MTITEPVYLATLGGFITQLLALAELKNIPKNRRPDFNEFVYWIPFLVNPLLGGIIGYAYFGSIDSTNRLLALHIGASAPLILRTMASSIPSTLNQSLNNKADEPKKETMEETI